MFFNTTLRQLCSGEVKQGSIVYVINVGFSFFTLSLRILCFLLLKLDQMEMVFTLTGNVEIVILFGQSRTYQVIARFF